MRRPKFLLTKYTRARFIEFVEEIEQHFVQHPDAGLDPSHPDLIKSMRETADIWRGITPEMRAIYIETGYLGGLRIMMV